ncbi:peptidase M1 [Asticcacaulis sp. AC460]|uniref:M1 family metallopeptidase n=1 Tax=Asticcacaulis sp. AC460 TaxID=1282360 RepID=UPI0003C3BB13|nr:M1 family metallopeptidase [Asticcacaulis sp. AC460]ESQ93055.1 peptidase M1 [Asticcacaulis sp. AC460]
MRALMLALSLGVSALAILPATATTVAAQAAAPAAPYPQGKLPDTAKPTAYRLILTIVPSKPRFSGHAEIDVQVKEQTSTLFIHGRDLKVATATVTQNGKTIKAKYTQVDPLGVVRLDFAKPVAAGAATLNFDYDAAFGDTAAGLYRIQVDGKWYVWSQFQSIDARAAFPSFDEPGFKTPFRVSVITEDGLEVASNAPEHMSQDEDSKLVRHQFYATAPLPTYLLAFAVGPFAVAQGMVPPTPQRPTPLPIRILATQPNAGKLQYALKETGPIVAHLEAYFNQAFPYPKLDQAASPVMPGAMENAGLDIYGDNILLLDEGADTEQKRSFGMVVSHELSHQWFGDYVTPAWWDDIWLNESFANWMGYRIGNAWRPELNIGAGANEEGFGAMHIDALKVGRPIHQPIVNSADIDQAFDGVTYGKGGQVVAMIAGYLGDDQFRDGVRLHMSRHPHGNATSDEFFAALADSAQDPKVLEAMKSFTSQQGVPVLEFSHLNGYLRVKQSRFAPMGVELAPQTWTIPLCLRRGADEACYMIDKVEGALAADVPGEIMPNAGGRGYYRFVLPAEDWDKLIATGATLSGVEGLAANDSLWAQFAVGKLDTSKLISAARVMAANPDSRVAVDGGGRLAGLRRNGLVAEDATADYRRVMASIYGPRLTALGFDPKAGAHASDSPDTQSLRTNLVDLVADDAHDEALRAKLKAAATAYLGGDKTALDQSILGLALAVHVEDGGLATAKALYETAMTSKDELFRATATSVVTSGATPETANWLFGVVLTDTRLRSTERLRLLGGLMGQPKSRDMTFDWYVANYEALSKGVGIFSASRLQTLGGGYCSVERAAQIDSIMRPKVEAAGRGTLAFDRTIERVRNCGVLKDAKAAEVTAAFKSAQ